MQGFRDSILHEISSGVPAIQSNIDYLSMLALGLVSLIVGAAIYSQWKKIFSYELLVNTSGIT